MKLLVPILFTICSLLCIPRPADGRRKAMDRFCKEHRCYWRKNCRVVMPIWKFDPYYSPIQCVGSQYWIRPAVNNQNDVCSVGFPLLHRITDPKSKDKGKLKYYFCSKEKPCPPSTFCKRGHWAYVCCFSDHTAPTKPGVCIHLPEPHMNAEEKRLKKLRCPDRCLNDIDCRGRYKCCEGRCGKKCWFI